MKKINFNNSNFYNMSERKKIEFSLSKLINNNEIFKNMNINYNWKYNMNNNDIEIDALFIFETTKINIVVFEFKHYRDRLCLCDPRNEDLSKKYNQISKFKKDLVHTYQNDFIDFYLIFSDIYNNNDYITYQTLKICHNSNINIDVTDEFFSILNSSDIKFHDKNLIQNIKTTPRDINYLIDSFKNPDKFQEIFNTRISSDISNSNKKIFLINGEAGSGKTNLACALFSMLQKSKFPTILFLINYKFLDEIKSYLKKNNLSFLTDDIVAISKDFENHNIWDNNEEKIIIIDEYQRLNYNNINFIKKKIKNKKIKFILFGDEIQSISKYDCGFHLNNIKNDEIKKIKLNNKNYRMPTCNIDYLKYIFYISNDKHNLSNFNLNIYANCNDFIKKFQQDNSWKVMTTLLKYNQCDKQSFFNDDFFKENNIIKSPKEISIYSQKNKNILNKYFFSAYDTISREIEKVYLFIPKDTYKMFNDSNDKNKIKEQIYINLTRATKEINVYIDDKEYLEMVLKRYNSK